MVADILLALGLIALFAVGVLLGYQAAKAGNRALDEVIAEAEESNPDPNTIPWSRHD